METFEKAYIGNCELKNRIIRSATFEGMCDDDGFPTVEYLKLYKKLSENEIGAIITGFAYISKEGKAMQPGQAGICSEKFIPLYERITTEVHKNNGKIFLQIAHTGRQTRKRNIDENVVGVSKKRSFYFNEKPKKLTESEIFQLIQNFGDSALYARQAGFDGVQLHAAHGYLIHQFILPTINNRKDKFGIDQKSKIGIKFLSLVIDNVKQKCGDNFPILVKISGGDDYRKRFSKKQFIGLIKFLNDKKVDGIEISYGTMDYALNIFRGDLPVNLILTKNGVFREYNKVAKVFLKLFIIPFIRSKLKPFSPNYNLNYAVEAKKYTDIPIISVGGFRKKEEIKNAISYHNIDFISMCRPFICEPDFVKKMLNSINYVSKCVNCNYCAIMCDTNNFTKCYKKGD